MPQPDLEPEPYAGACPTQLFLADADSLEPRARPARLRLLRPLGSHEPWGRLRELPRPRRSDGAGLPSGLAHHAVVPGLSSCTRNAPQTCRASHQHEMVERRRPKLDRARARVRRPKPDALLDLPPAAPCR